MGLEEERVAGRVTVEVEKEGGVEEETGVEAKEMVTGLDWMLV